jgi:hypothetical protein
MRSVSPLRFRLLSAASFALLLVCSPAVAQAQVGGPCVDTTSTRAQSYRDSYVEIASGTRAELVQARTQAGIPTVLASQVKLVGDTVVCRAASIAFDARVQNPRPSTPVIVLEIGPTRRIVVKETGRRSVGHNMLFDQTFATLLKTIRF